MPAEYALGRKLMMTSRRQSERKNKEELLSAPFVVRVKLDDEALMGSRL
jgi:hypothetical protein